MWNKRKDRRRSPLTVPGDGWDSFMVLMPDHRLANILEAARRNPGKGDGRMVEAARREWMRREQARACSRGAEEALQNGLEA